MQEFDTNRLRSYVRKILKGFVFDQQTCVTQKEEKFIYTIKRLQFLIKQFGWELKCVRQCSLVLCYVATGMM